MKTIFPPPLKPNDKIAIVSPSGVIDSAYIDGAVARLKKWEFEPVIFPHAKNIYGRYAGTIGERTADLQKAINDHSIKAILCSRGGYGAIQIIENIDFKPLVVNPKWLIGFSDITIFHVALSQLNIASVHGIMAKHLTENASNSNSVRLLHNILTGKLPSYSLTSHPLNRTGEAKMGGKLDQALDRVNEAINQSPISDKLDSINKKIIEKGLPVVDAIDKTAQAVGIELPTSRVYKALGAINTFNEQTEGDFIENPSAYLDRLIGKGDEKGIEP